MLGDSTGHDVDGLVGVNARATGDVGVRATVGG